MGQCCSAPRGVKVVQSDVVVAAGQPSWGDDRGLTIAAPLHEQPGNQTPHSGSASSSLSPASEKRRRAVAASPTRFFELLAEPSAKTRTELLQRATIEYQSNNDLAPFAPDSPQHSIVSNLKVDSPQNSVKSRLNALFSKPPPNKDAALLQDMCGETWIPRSCLHNWRPLGSGAFAVVQQCVLKLDSGLEVPVAVKKLKAHVLSNTADLREFLSEANTLRRLKHRHIVEFKGVGCVEPHTPETMASSLFIVQEFMSGNTLKVHVLHQMFPSNSSAVEAAYSWKDALRWLQQIAGALKYLHGLRPMVVHRDLKLENLLLTGTNPAKADAKLADFGLCKLIKDSAIALPFVPSTPNSNPHSQRNPGATQPPLGQPEPSTRPTDGQAVGSTPQQPPSNPQHADDSAHASTSHTDADASSSLRSASVAAAIIDTQSSHSVNTATADAAMDSHVGRHVNNQAGSSSQSVIKSQQQSLHGSHVNTVAEQPQADSQGSTDAAMQSLNQLNAQANRAGVEDQSHATDQSLIVQAANKQPMINTALSISAKEASVIPQLGTPTAQGGTLDPQGVSPSILGLNPSAQGGSSSSQRVVTPPQGVSPSAQPSSSAASGHATSSQCQAVHTTDSMQETVAANASAKAGVKFCLTSNANSDASPEARAASSAVSDADKPNDGQNQGRTEALIPAFMGAAAEAGQGQGQGQARSAAAGPGEEGEVLYNMTGQTGSLMYMAPEVMKGQSYNEKVDVFSFAVIIFELLSYRVAMAAIGDNRDLDYEAVHAHAQEVSHGYRLPLPSSWPPAVQALIRDCWAQKSSHRPSCAAIEQRLADIQASGVIDEYLATLPSKKSADTSTSTGCVIQ